MNELKNTHRYDDIIRRERPASDRHPKMPPEDRAAQFSPFATLSGYGAVIRATEKRHEDDMLLGEGISREPFA